MCVPAGDYVLRLQGRLAGRPARPVHPRLGSRVPLHLNHHPNPACACAPCSYVYKQIVHVLDNSFADADRWVQPELGPARSGQRLRMCVFLASLPPMHGRFPSPFAVLLPSPLLGALSQKAQDPTTAPLARLAGDMAANGPTCSFFVRALSRPCPPLLQHLQPAHPRPAAPVRPRPAKAGGI